MFEPIDMPFAADSCGSKESCVRWVKVGRIHSLPGGVTTRRFGLRTES